MKGTIEGIVCRVLFLYMTTNYKKQLDELKALVTQKLARYHFFINKIPEEIEFHEYDIIILLEF